MYNTCIHSYIIIYSYIYTHISLYIHIDGTKDQYKVTYSNGDSDVFDTVLCAIGRQADITKLGLDTLGVQVNPKTNKIIAVNEQTTVPNIYAIGMCVMCVIV